MADERTQPDLRTLEGQLDFLNYHAPDAVAIDQHAAVNDATQNCMAIVKETGALSDREKKSTPLKLKEENVEGFVIGMCESIGLDPAFAMSILGVIAYADGKLKKHIHLPTLSAHMSKEAARYGYEVEMLKPEWLP